MSHTKYVHRNHGIKNHKHIPEIICKIKSNQEVILIITAGDKRYSCVCNSIVIQKPIYALPPSHKHTRGAIIMTVSKDLANWLITTQASQTMT